MNSGRIQIPLVGVMLSILFARVYRIAAIVTTSQGFTIAVILRSSMQRPSAVLFFIALAAVALPAQSAKRTVTLNIVEHVTESDGTATITLVSGRKIVVSTADVVAAPAAVSPLASIDDVIKGKCTRDWPTDSRAQFNCQSRQHAGVMAISKRQVATTTPEYGIVHAACERQFPDDFVLRNVCEEQQMKALRH
jgi:hypothetical protein